MSPRIRLHLGFTPNDRQLRLCWTQPHGNFAIHIPHAICEILRRRSHDQTHHHRTCNNHSDNNHNVRTFDAATCASQASGTATFTHQQPLAASTPHAHASNSYNNFIAHPRHKIIYKCRPKCTPTCSSSIWSQLYFPAYFIADINRLSPSTSDNINTPRIRLMRPPSFLEHNGAAGIYYRRSET
jgi:hypothetical protein